MATSSRPPVPGITLSPSNTTQAILFQAYCLNPPSDSCIYGPCPNADVTGVGQQVSIYITSIMFAIALVYVPSLVRPFLYAHLALVYSLLIAALISILVTQLTQNDGVFILVAVASPASIYLWTLTLASLWKSDWFPARIPGKPKSREILVLKLFSLGSLAFEIAMICVMFAPSERLNFSQPACNKAFGRKLWIKLVWEFTYVLQMVWILLVVGVSRLIFKFIYRNQHKAGANSPESIAYREDGSRGDWNFWECAAKSDVVTWTRVSLEHKFPATVTPFMTSAILAVLQLCALPRISFKINQDIAFALILIIGFWIPSRSPVVRPLKYRILVPLLLIGLYLLTAVLWPIIPPFSDFVLIYICLTLSWSRFGPPGTPTWKLIVRRIILILGLVVALSASLLSWAFSSDNLHDFFSDDSTTWAVDSPLPPFVLGFQPLFLNLYTLPWWLVYWLATSVWPRASMPYSKIWKVTASRAHILKASLLIIGPNALWVQSSIASNPTPSLNMTFGQIFALIVSAMTLTSILDEIRVVKSDVWWAVVKSETIPGDADADDMEAFGPLHDSPSTPLMALLPQKPLRSLSHSDPSTEYIP